jgi:membrane-associated protease RseP (regulator of RpoE activity)
MSEPSSPQPASAPDYENAIPVFVATPRPRQRYWLHVLLFLLTIFTTLTVGARMQEEFQHGQPAFSDDMDFFPYQWMLAKPMSAIPARLLSGIPFSFTLMLILFSHEMGHYLYCLRYRVNATLPFFIPVPTAIGTLGAFIRIRGPMRSRRALFDIGIAGPIAGFVVAIAVLVIALLLSRPAGGAASLTAMPSWNDLVNASPPREMDHLPVGIPLIFRVVYRVMSLGKPAFVPLDRMLLHPMAVAAWVGMFATALNLLPGGQLDGGHITFALWPEAHRWISRFTILLLIPMGLFLWSGWLFWAGLLIVSGTRHPPVGWRYMKRMGFDWAPAEQWEHLGRTRATLAALALVMLFVTVLPVPFPGAGGTPWQSVHRFLLRHR